MLPSAGKKGVGKGNNDDKTSQGSGGSKDDDKKGMLVKAVVKLDISNQAGRLLDRLISFYIIKHSLNRKLLQGVMVVSYYEGVFTVTLNCIYSGKNL